jgi:hypothetical protein
MGGLLIEVDPVDVLVHLSKPLLPQIILQRRSVLTHRERAGLDGHELHAEGVGDRLGGLAHGTHRRHGKEEWDEEDADGFHGLVIHFFGAGAGALIHARLKT